jgi:hypothetical protein
MASAKSAALKKDTGKATTAVAVRKPSSGAVVNLQEELRKQAAAMNERTMPPGGNKIQVGQDKMFKLPDGSKVPEITVCIVDFAVVHNFYENGFDPKNIVPPGCFAVGFNPKQMAPVPESPNLQAEDCQTCPMNQFGSDGDGKACKNGRLLAVLPANDAGDDVDHEADILLLNVSPTALKGFDAFVQSISRTFQTPPVGVLCKVSFDPNQTYSRLMFSDPTPIQSVGEAFARQAEAKDMLTRLPDFSGWVDPKTARGKPTGKSAPAAKNARR